MKKILSITLCALMLICIIPLGAYAEDIVFDANGDFTASDQLISGNQYTIPNEITMTVPFDMTMYIPTDSQLTVEAGGKLIVNGNIVTQPGGVVSIKGAVVNASHITGQGTQRAEIRFPSLVSAGLEGKVDVSYAVSESGSAYEDMTGNLVFEAVPDSGGSVWCALNQYLYINAHIKEPDIKYDKFDDSLMNVYINGIGVPFAQGSHHTLVGTAGDVTYSKWTNENDFLSTFNVYLPTGKGYTVYGREGEQSADGETVRLKYGKPFSFKVEIDPKFDMSIYEVYIYNGYGWTNLDTATLLKDIEPAKPDEYGYYSIPEVKGEYTIYVIDRKSVV